ncbi:hypothetical protein [Microvirga massiliensis]|uniref:hypothetical protein n=1 Tax=Microvirga massiliensis TaxID=1033741 RepID=UPI000660B793|nr:hypothetical protein [Microvirga massiliensis]
MSAALAQILTDFSAPKGQEAALAALLKPVRPAVKTSVEPEAPPEARPKVNPAEERAEAIRKAVEAARDEERALARAELAQALAAERERFQIELQEQRQVWAEAEGAELGARFGQAFTALEAMLSERVANILGPFVAEAFRRQMIDELGAALKSLLADATAETIVVAGPKDLLAALEASLGDQLGSVEFKVAKSIDVSVTAADTAIDTLLKPWSERLNDLLKAL